MSRYLSPQRVAILALICVYTDGVVLSHAAVPVLSFIVSNAVVAKAGKCSMSSTNELLDVSLQHFEKVLAVHTSGIPGRTVWDLFLKRLWEINCFDAFDVFFTSLEYTLQQTRKELTISTSRSLPTSPDAILLSRKSPLGILVRRAQIEFRRLQVHNALSLWKDFIQYKAPSYSSWKRRNPGASDTSFDVSLIQEGLTLEDRLPSIIYDRPLSNTPEHHASTADVERLLEFQVDRMQMYGMRIDEAIKTQLECVARSALTLPSLIHYVKFLDAWKAGDYPSSFDFLHRYFDYTMQNRDRAFYQYALLNLAILHADFGCFSEAVSAMEEAISTARENKDTSCLNYSLSWLASFGKSHPSELAEIRKSGVLGTEREALSFLKAKARETNMWSLLSTSLLSEARLTITNGEGLQGAFECIIKASHLNISKNIANAVGSQLAMQMSLYNRLGESLIASLTNTVFMECYAEQSPTEDRLHCVTSSACMLAQAGRYRDALAIMDLIDTEALRTLKYRQHWLAYVGLLKLEHSILRGDLIAADRFMFQLRATPPPNQVFDFTLKLKAIEQEMRRKDYAKAMEALEDTAASLPEEDVDIFQQIKLLIMRARILDRAGVPEKGLSVATRAVKMAHKAQILPVLYEAAQALARVLLSLREFAAAAALLDSIMPQVLECNDCELTGNGFTIIGDAHIGMAGEAKGESLWKRKEKVTKALSYFERAEVEFGRIVDVNGQCESLAKKGMILMMAGDKSLAEGCAARYIGIQKAAREDYL
ncbi:anaphase promoting complex subunit 5 [Agyrium rufum]|nr:anaphase promoting complex subunit 5 [Agyrium rufum]